MPLSSASARPPSSPSPGWWGRVVALVRTPLVDHGLEELDIRWRFRMVVLAFGLPFLGYMVWVASEQASIEKAHARERARGHAVLTATRLDDHVRQIDRLLATAAQSIGTRIDDVPAIGQLLQGMRPHVPRSLNNLAVWTPAGVNLVSLDRPASGRSTNIADRAYFRETIAERGLAIGALSVSRSTGEPVVQFARPILARDGALVGVITMSMRLVDLVTEIDPDGLVSGRALVTVLDADGRILSRSVDARGWIGRQGADPGHAAAAFSGRSGARERLGVDGLLQLAGYARTTRLDWVVLVSEPIEVAIAPVSDRLLKTLGVGLAIFALAMFVASRVARWTVTPLLRLAADADRLGNGDLAHRSGVVTGGEIAALAGNFNRMAAALEEREAAFAASQTQLHAIADNIPAQICYIDRDERYRFANAFRGRFPHLGAVIGRTVREVRGEELYAMIQPAMQRAMAGDHSSVEGTGKHEGELFHFRCSWVPDRAADGRVRGIYAFAQDITERRNAEILRDESERRLATITDNLPVMICYVDHTKCFRFVNRAFEKWFARPVAEIVGRPFGELMPPDVVMEYDYHFQRGMKGEQLTYDVQVPTREGGVRCLRSTFVPDRAADGSVRGVYGMVHDVTAAKEAERRLTQLAQFDTLTGLANRHQFNETFARALAKNDADGMPLALMFLDIDHFKQVNDRFGHACGDALLKQFATRLVESVRPTDVVARLAGDEFVVILEGLHSDDEPLFVARKIIAAAHKPFLIDGCYLNVSASIGISMRAHAGDPASSLMKRADEALYEAKRAGRDTFRIAS